MVVATLFYPPRVIRGAGIGIFCDLRSNYRSDEDEITMMGGIKSAETQTIFHLVTAG